MPTFRGSNKLKSIVFTSACKSTVVCCILCSRVTAAVESSARATSDWNAGFCEELLTIVHHFLSVYRHIYTDRTYYQEMKIRFQLSGYEPWHGSEFELKCCRGMNIIIGSEIQTIFTTKYSPFTEHSESCECC